MFKNKGVAYEISKTKWNEKVEWKQERIKI
jgi:hypothetical protein